MSNKNFEEEKRYRSLNAHVVFFVFMIMLTSGAISVIIINALDAFGFIGNAKLIPMLLPLVMLCTSTVIGSMITAVFAGRFLAPLEELKEAMERVSKGDFSVKIEEINENNELGLLQESFNVMVKELGSTEMFRKDFINNFSHEFKTPMVSVYGFARQLKKGGLTKEQEQEYIDIILTESQRLINMSSNILMLNKLENQEIITDKKLFRLDEEIRRCILMLEMQWSAKNIAVIPELDQTEFYGNPEMLKQIWLNVIGNAIKYTDAGGEIAVTLAREEENPSFVRITVRDNGIGMDEATCARIFEKFYQGDLSRSTGGNGLGLAMVKRITELCGGVITVESEPGAGAEFVIRLPDERPAEKEKRKKKSLNPVNTAGLK